MLSLGIETLPLPAVGQYLYTCSQHASSTSAALGNGTLRLAPMIFPYPIRIDRIGAEVTGAGEAGSKFRIGVYYGAGNCTPGALLLDAGQIDGASATVQEITVDLVIPAGVIWFGGAVQSAPSSQPNMRIATSWHPPIMVPMGTSTPSAANVINGRRQDTIGNGALPASATGTGNSSLAPRVFVRRAL